MKINRLYCFYFTFFVAALSLSLLKPAVQKEPGTNPGWHEQYTAMKNFQPGTQYFGLRNKWAASDKLYKKSGDAIENITEVGPQNVGGRVRALLIDAADTTHILAGGISGGLWTSYNGGNSWKPVDEHCISMAVSCITQNPMDPKEIYYGTGEGTGNSADISGGGIFKSVDGGKTFSQLPASLKIPGIGITWDIEFSKTDKNTFYVGLGNNGLYRSRDGGASFEKIFTTSREVNEILTYRDSTVWFSVNGYGIMSGLERDTMKFNLLSGGLPTSGMGRISMDYCKKVDRVAYAQVLASAGSSLLGIYKTSNRGKSWKKVTSPVISGMYAFGWYCLNTAVNPVDTNFLAVGSVTNVASSNGGTTWSSMRASHADNHSAAYYPSGQSFLIGNDGGVYRFDRKTVTSNNESLNNGLNITQFYTGSQSELNSSIFITGSQDNGTHYYNGTGFVKAYGGDGSYCALSPTPPYYTYVSYQNGEIRRFSGTNFWGETNIKPTGAYAFWFINPFEMNPLDGNQLFFLAKTRIIFSGNAGTGWSNLTNNLTKQVISLGLSYSKDPTVYFGGGGTTLYRAKNGATGTGQEVDLSTTAPTLARGSVINCIKVSRTNPQTVYLSMSDVNVKPRVWKLNNAETENPVWTNISGNLPESLPVNCIEVNPRDSNVILAGTDFGLYTTTNHGATWFKETSVPNVPVMKITSHTGSGKIFIYTHGRGVFQAHYKGFVNSVKRMNSSVPVVRINNPVQDELIIHSPTQAGQESGRVRIFQTGGQLLFEGDLLPETRVSMAGNTHGIYFLQWDIEGSTGVLKFIKN